ncbi:zinc finger protein ZIC 5-like [Lethenteron reissneri]|uniref:zinc finger protein ZIC 5-like n=1 Tax=Lethenteron reissneri TaxID=7753 RepID=UPI002AB64042|nr:zinc finger protein ZIC 5-like [Lethenteron reissneri]
MAAPRPKDFVTTMATAALLSDAPRPAPAAAAPAAPAAAPAAPVPAAPAAGDVAGGGVDCEQPEELAVVWAAGKLRSIFTLLVECEEDDHVLACACEVLQILSSSHAGALAFNNNGSLAALASLLGRTHNPHTLEKITGTLWNLSCHESLRAALVELCLPALVEHVLVPESGWRSNFGDSPASPSPPGSSASPSAAFCNALTCLRVADPAGEPEPTAPPPTAPPPTAPPPTAAALAAAAPTAPPAAAMSPRELHQLRDELRDLQRELGGRRRDPTRSPQSRSPLAPPPAELEGDAYGG